jgi:tRNA pseudouridine55 synthase
MSEGPHGVVAVDKPGGMTSHDVVARARRMLRTRKIGHAGTLDPMATGVLVLLVGEGTKLGPYLTAHRKTYVARVAFGATTDTLDREGRVTATGEVPAWLREELSGATARPRLTAALAAELARTEQVPPAYSAIQVDGRRSYDRARAGEVVELPPRPVEALGLRVLDSAVPEGDALPFADIEVEVSKGYYVRSLARDLGERLGVPAHLTALRRIASGPFAIERAVKLEPEAMAAGLVPLDEAAAAALPSGRLTEEGAVRARHGKRLAPDDFAALSPEGEAAAWFDPRGHLVAVGTRAAEESAKEAPPEGTEPAGFVLHRGFAE